jgi:molybdenum-dependent DNA-binding transcriptional regulator ModE
VCDVDLVVVRKAIGEASAWTQRRWRRGGGRGGGAAVRVTGEMIVARVRI